MMPTKTIWVLLPSGTEVTNVKIVSTKEKQLDGQYYIYPIQYPVTTGDQGERKFVEPKKGIYASNENYPGKLAEFYHENYFRDYHIAQISIYPLQYKPAQQKLTLNTEISIEIDYSASSKYKPLLRMRQNVEKQNEMAALVKILVVNPEDISLSSSTPSEGSKLTTSIKGKVKAVAQPLSISYTPSATEGQDVNYVIITADSLVSSFQRLADWKTKKGVVTTIKTVSWISQNYSGSDLQEKIRHFIQDAYSNWGTDYILLGGTVDIIPSRVIQKINKMALGPVITDQYYSALNGNWNANGNDLIGEEFGDFNINYLDYLGEIWVGRAPVHNSVDVNIFINKVFTYERNSMAPAPLPSSIYLTKMLSLGGLVSTPFKYAGSGIDNIETASQEVRTLDPLITNYKMYEYDASVDYSQVSLPYSHLNFTDAINSINTGYGIINHCDHSSFFTMGMGKETSVGLLGTNDVDKLTNGKQCSIVITGGCCPGALDYDCIGEHFILCKSGGAVAFIGASRTNDNDPEYFSDFDFNFFSFLLSSDSIYNIGYTFALAKNGGNTALLVDPYEIMIMNLLGDPEMPIWTKPPQNLIVSYPATIQNRSDSITVTINNLSNNTKAVVCLQKGTEVYAVQTVAGTGNAVSTTFQVTPNTPGTLNVTVTAHNFIPNEGTVTVTQTSPANLCVSSYSIDDDSIGLSIGNGNGTVDAGETIEMPVKLKNSGSTAANSVVATLAAYINGTSNSNPYITILQGTEHFGNMAARDSVTSSDKFIFKVLTGSHKDTDKVECKLTITDSASHIWYQTFYIQVDTPQVQHTANIVSGTLQASTKDTIAVQLSNYGTGIARGIKAWLTPSTGSSVDSVTGSPQTFGDINLDSSITRIFYFKIKSGYTPGNEQLLSFSLNIQDAYGQVWTQIFDLKKPTLPSIPSFTPYETAIDVLWEAPNIYQTTDLQGYNVYRSESSTGIYQKINKRLIEGTSYFKDVGLNKDATYFYKVSAVDQSANESALTNPMQGWTTLQSVNGWPIQTDDIINASPTLADINNDGKAEIFEASTSQCHGGKAYAWDYSGKALFNIDTNATTMSGLANVAGANFWGSPAIADLVGNGINELVIAGRGSDFIPPYGDTLYCWKIKDGNGDGKPDLYWKVNLGSPCMGSPAIGDIDGDGKKEIVILSEDGNIHIRRYDGTVYGSDPWPLNTNIGGGPSGGPNYCTPALADLEHNGKLEIIIGGGDGKLHVFRPDGTEMWNYNTHSNNLTSSPAVADIDGDGKYEIIFISGQWMSSGGADGYSGNDYIYVMNETGGYKMNWNGGEPMLIASMSSVVYPSPAVGDLRGDGTLDIVFATGSYIYTLDCNGAFLSRGPISGFAASFSSPVIANIDGTYGGQQVIIGSSDHSLHAWHNWHGDASQVMDWPLPTKDRIDATPAIGDVDGDGYNEVVVGSLDKFVYNWKTKGSIGKDWPMFHHDAQHSGCFTRHVRCNITSNITWTGTVYIDSTVAVNSGVTLTITPGTKIICATGATLIVNGILRANGTSSQPISFGPSNLPNSWGGIQINTGSGRVSRSTIEYCNIKNATIGIYVYSASPYICYNNISGQGGYGIYSYSASPFLYNNTITGQGYGMYFGNNGSPWLANPLYSPYAPGYNTITSNGMGIIANGCSPFLGSTAPCGGYNSIYSNGTVDLMASGGNGVYIWAQNNYWGSGTPNLIQSGGVVINWLPQLSTKPTLQGTSAASNIIAAAPSQVKAPSIGSVSSNDAAQSTVNASSSEITELQSLLALEKNGKIDEAISGYLQLFKNGISNNAKKYTLSCLLECYSQSGKTDFSAFLNNQIRPGLAATDTLYATTLEVENIFLIRNGKINQALENYKALIKTFSNNEHIYKNSLFNAWYLNYYQLGNTAQASINYKALKASYPKDELTLIASFMTGETNSASMIEAIKSNAIAGSAKQAESVSAALPTIMKLEANYPNPFNPSTVIRYQLPNTGHVNMSVFDILGRQVTTLVNGQKDAGYYSAIFDGSKFASGVYFVRLIVQGSNSKPFVKTVKMLLAK